MLEDLAIAFSGGGFKCSFGAGQMTALHEMGIDAKIMIGASGNTPNAAYQMTGQTNDRFRIWSEQVPLEEISKERSKRINIKRVVEVFRSIHPLDQETFYSSPTELYVSVTNSETGETEYLRAKDHDILEVIHATMSLPIAYQINPKIQIGDKHYCDSMKAGVARAHIPQALDLGARKIIAIDNSPKVRGYDVIANTFRYWSRLKGRTFHENYMKRLDEINKINLTEVSVLELAPDMNSFQMSTVDNSVNQMIWGLDNGYLQTMARRTEIEDFLA